MRYIRHYKKGFTLVEMLVYMAVLVLIAGALVTTFLSLNTVLLRNATERTLTHAATVSLERMVRDMRSADTVNTGLSTLGTSPGTLALTDGATTTRFYISSGRLVVSVNGVELGPLTPEEVTVEDLIFQRYVGATTEMVRASLTLSVSSKAASSTRTYYGSGVLRGSYE